MPTTTITTDRPIAPPAPIDTSTIVIPTRFNGPIDSGHGGYAAGRFAALVNSRRAAVRFRRPIPLATPLSAQATSEGSTELLTNKRDIIATVTPLARPLRVEPFQRVTTKEVQVAEDSWKRGVATEHPCPTCYACGPNRTSGGLGLRPGRVERRGVHVTSWSTNRDGDMPDWLVWAALDCPSGAPALSAIGPSELVLTGTLSVDILRRVPGRGDFQLHGRLDSCDGVKYTTSAALLLGDQCLAVAKAIWIAVPRSAQESAA